MQELKKKAIITGPQKVLIISLQSKCNPIMSNICKSLLLSMFLMTILSDTSSLIPVIIVTTSLQFILSIWCFLFLLLNILKVFWLRSLKIVVFYSICDGNNFDLFSLHAAKLWQIFIPKAGFLSDFLSFLCRKERGFLIIHQTWGI